MPLPANTSGCAFASATVSGSSGQPGVSATYPASSNTAAQGSQLEGSSHSPCTKTTGVAVDAFARSTCSSSWSEIVIGSVVSVLMDCSFSSDTTPAGAGSTQAPVTVGRPLTPQAGGSDTSNPTHHLKPKRPESHRSHAYFESCLPSLVLDLASSRRDYTSNLRHTRSGDRRRERRHRQPNPRARRTGRSGHVPRAAAARRPRRRHPPPAPRPRGPSAAWGRGSRPPELPRRPAGEV